MLPVLRLVLGCLVWLGMLVVLAGCGASGGGPVSSPYVPGPSPGVTLVDLAIAPSSAPASSPIQLTAARTQALKATATYSDASRQDVSAAVVWSSSNLAAARVDDHGLATGVAVGNSTIAAAFGGLHAQVDLAVVKPSWTTPVSLSPTGGTVLCPQVRMAADGSQTVANWIFSDGVHSQFQGIAAASHNAPLQWAPSATDLWAVGRDVQHPLMAISADGTRATALWFCNQGGNRLQTASAILDGSTLSWGPVVDLALPYMSYNVVPGDPTCDFALAISADGARATAIWATQQNGGIVVEAASALIQGNQAQWSPPVLTGPSLLYGAANFRLALSADGSRATALWTAVASTSLQSASATIDGLTGSWGPVTNLALQQYEVIDPDLALSADGRQAVAVWSDVAPIEYPQTVPGNKIVQTAAAAIDGTQASWSAPRLLSGPGKDGLHPHAALSSDGSRASAIWSLYDGSLATVETTSATLQGAQATWGTVTDLAQGQDAYDPVLALSADGTRATAAWSSDTNPLYVVQAASASLEGVRATWSTPQTLSAAGQSAFSPQVAVSADGSLATVMWLAVQAGYTLIQSASYGF